MSLYLGDNLISGVAYPVEPSRNIGQIIESTLPLSDAGLHLLDGALINGGGIYSGFVDYIADLYDDTTSSWETYIQPTNPSGITSSSGFSNPLNAFDNNSSTYASCGTTTDYIEWDLGETLKVSGFNATIQWVSGSAASCNISIYSVDSNNNETLIANGSGVPQGASGTSSAQFSGIEVSKLRFKCIPNDGGQSLSTSTPSRVVQINIIAQREVKPCFCTEALWQQSVTTYGVCGKFVYDSVNNTVRLPKITGIVEGTTDLTALGDLIEAGLPDHIHYVSRSGDISNESVTSEGTGGSDTVVNYNGYMIRNTSNASVANSNSLYGKSNTVQPQTIKVLYYIVLATNTKTEIEVDIDEIATDLNGKVDIASLTPVHCVVETYVNGTSWYRIYDDGWCEQGGRGALNETSTTTITLLKPYINTEYFVSAVSITASTAGDNEVGLQCTPISTTQITLTAHYINPNSQTACWEAKGYIN